MHYDTAAQEATELFLALAGMTGSNRDVLIQLLYRASNRNEIYGEEICTVFNRLSNLAQEIRKAEHEREKILTRADRRGNLIKTRFNETLAEEFAAIVGD
jgi:hypothetical protein